MSDTPEHSMTFFEHLKELRDRLVRVTLYVVAAFFVTWEFHEALFTFVAAPIRDGLAAHGVYTFRSIEIAETMFVYLKLSVVAAIMLTLPLTFGELWRFVAPGLYERERQAIYPVIFFSCLFFMLGAWFAYEVVLPFLASYLAELTLDTSGVEMDVTVKSAFDFAILLLLGFGVSFELPMVMFFLAAMGLVTARTYIRVFRYFIVVSFVVAGILTPPDPISQTMMAVPLNLLYWVGVLGAWAVERRKDSGAEGPLMAFRARVWGLLGLSLIGVAAALYGVTWWLGRSTSPFRLVPSDAVSVTSVRFASLADAPPPDASVRAWLTAAAGSLPDGLPSPLEGHVVLIRLADDSVVAVLAEGCAGGEDCIGDERVIGPTAAVDSLRRIEQSLEKSQEMAELNASGPAFHWDRAPARDWLSAFPGTTPPPGPKLTGVRVVADLRSSAPRLSLAVTLDAPGAVPGVVARADLWRHDQRKAADGGASQLARSVGELGSVLAEAIEQGALPAERKAALAARIAALTTRIGAGGPPAGAEAGSSFVQRMGNAAATWKVDGADKTVTLTLGLVPGEAMAALAAP